EHEPRTPLSASPERRAGLCRRLRADLERYLEHAARAAGEAGAGAAAEPTHFELDFGLRPAGVGGEPGALLDAAAAAARKAAEQAARGELEPRPETCTPRGGCAYPALCRCRR